MNQTSAHVHVHGQGQCVFVEQSILYYLYLWNWFLSVDNSFCLKSIAPPTSNEVSLHHLEDHSFNYDLTSLNMLEVNKIA